MSKKCIVKRDSEGNIDIKISDRNNIFELAKNRNNGYSLDKAPNGKPSELYSSLVDVLEIDPQIAREIIATTYTDEFGNWFGRWWTGEISSKMLDSNGQPMVYYHGSPNIFEEFNTDKIFFTSDPSYGLAFSVNNIADVVENGKEPEYGELYPVFLNVRELGMSSSDLDNNVVNKHNEDGIIGYDKNTDEEVVVIFDPKNVKSIFNEGYYSDAVTNIYKQKDSNIETRVDIPLEEVKIVANTLSKKGLVRKVHFKTGQEIQDKLKEYGEESIIRVLPGINSEINGDQGMYSSGELGENNTGTEQGNEGGQYRINYHLVPVSDSSKAEELEKQGLSELGIKRQTGIERGRDGIWRKEIPTKEIDLSESKFKRVWHGDFDILEEADLTDIYNNEDLYKEFPQLKNTVVYLYDGFKHDPEDSNEGFQYGGHIFINKRRNREDKSRRKHILFHEIQHLIQRASGTSGGTNFDRMLGEIESRYSGLDKDTGGDTLFTRVLDEHVKDVTKSKYDSFSKLPSSEFNRIKRALAQRMYDSKYGEIEAETAARRGLHPNQDLRNVTLFKDADRYIEQGVWYSDSDLKYHLVPVEDSSSAEELEKQGLNELDIKNRTGLERGRDGIWRKEIGVGKFDFNAEGTLTENPYFIGKVNVNKLKEVYDNQELYNQYPFLKDVEVVSYEKSNNNIFNNIDGFQYEGRIYINNSELREATPEDVVLHEIQHLIQRASGTTAGTVFEAERDRVFEEFERRYDEAGVDKEYSRVFRNQLLDIFKGKETSVKFLFTEEGKAYRPLVAEDLADRMYKSKYGEVEARNASYRSMNMTDSERRNSLYKDTETFVENGVWFDNNLRYHIVPSSDNAEAEKLESQGKNVLEIKSKTGLERGRDGIWRKEIPTKEIDLSESKFKRVRHTDFELLEEADLTDIYDNEELYKEFPQLKDTAVYLYEGFKGDPGNTSEGFQYGGHIFINKRFTDANESRRKHILLHEIQHFIQRASGTSHGTNFPRLLDEIAQRYSRPKNEVDSDSLFSKVLDAKVDDIRYSNNSSNVNGFYDTKTKDIWINKDNSRKILGTTIHEFAHPYLDYIEKHKPELFAAGIELIKKSREELKPYFERVHQHYLSLPENEQFKEVLAEIVADEGVRITNKKVKRNIWYWLSDFFKEIGKIIGLSKKTPKQVSRMTVKGFARSVLADMLDGKNLLSNPHLRPGQLMEIGKMYDTDMVARERFDIDSLTKIGAGSDRVTYDLGDGRVLKVAKTARGLAQNIAETDIYLTGSTLPMVYEVGLNYNVVDKVDQMKTTDKIPLFKDGEETGEFTTAKDMMADLASLSYEDYRYKTDNFYKVMDKYDLHEVADYEVMIGDLSRIKNWGMKNGYPIHLDGGTFNTQILSDYRGVRNMEDADFREVYNQSKKWKSFFEDSDTGYKFSKDLVSTVKLEEVTPKDVSSELYNEIKSLPGISQEEALDIYKTIYTEDFIFHKDENIKC